MTAPILSAAIFLLTLTAVQISSITIAIVRLRRTVSTQPLSTQQPPVSLVRPLCGIDNYAAETLQSTFELDYPYYEILFCVARADDTVLPLVKSLIAAHPGVAARLLVGDDRVSANPKLNNVVKGWRAASHAWIIIADSNVLMPRDYIQRLFASWRADTGLVASPPIGSQPRGFWAEVECASSTLIRRVGSTWSTVSGAVLLRAKQCCGGAPSLSAPAGSRRLAARSPKTQRRRRSCVAPG